MNKEKLIEFLKNENLWCRELENLISKSDNIQITGNVQMTFSKFNGEYYEDFYTWNFIFEDINRSWCIWHDLKCI